MNHSPEVLMARVKEANTSLFKQMANEDQKAYPQYKGAFDNWVLVRLKKSIRTKFGLAFAKGEYAIADPVIGRHGTPGFPEGYNDVEVYSNRNKIGTLVSKQSVEFL